MLCVVDRCVVSAHVQFLLSESVCALVPRAVLVAFLAEETLEERLAAARRCRCRPVLAALHSVADDPGGALDGGTRSSSAVSSSSVAEADVANKIRERVRE